MVLSIMGLMTAQLVLGLTFLGIAAGQKTTYNMDDRNDCNLAGVIEVGNDQTFYINAKQNAISTGISSCRIDFQAREVQRQLKVEFRQFYFTGSSPCPVNLYLFFSGITQPSRTYNCMAPRPSDDFTESRSVSVRFDKVAVDNIEYNFQIVLTTYLDLHGGGSTGNTNTPLNAGVIVGIVAGVVVLLVILLVILCCCCRRQQGRHDEEAKVRLGDHEPSSHSMAYVNENGRVYSDNGMKPKVTSFDGPGSPKTRNISEYEEKPPMLTSFDTSPTRNQNFRYTERAVEKQWKNQAPEEQDDDVPQSPLLVAIRNSARHKTHFRDTEAEAEERAKRFSKSSSAPSSPGGDPPTPPPSLPILPRENILRYPQKPLGPKQASIRRAPRPTSSNEEIARIDRMFETEDGDENIQIIPDSPLEKSQPEGVVAIQTADPHTPSPQRRGPFTSAAFDTEEFYDDEEIEEYKPQNNTQHTLRPNRKRSPGAEKRKPPEPRGPNKKQPSNQGSKQPGNGRLPSEAPDRKEPSKKKPQKSPRLGSLRKPRPSAASRLDDDDILPPRPETPTSIVAKGFRTDDLEAFSPLQRTGSRQSLYASRSSLYGRRGRRDRASFSESVASYAHDDIDVYRHRRDGDEDRQISQKDRYFKSLGDIHYGGPPREQSTQTLRETASQTGSGMVTNSKPRRSTQRKSPKTQRAMSSSATQTKQNKQSESDTKAPRYVKAAPKTKTSKSVETGVGNNGTEKKSNGKHRSNGKRSESSSQRPKTPEPVQSEAELQPRAVTPDNILQNQPATAPSPVPSVPVSNAPQAPPNYIPTVPANYQEPASLVNQPQPSHAYTPPPIHNYSAPPRSSPSPAPYGPPPIGRPAKSPWEVLCDLTEGEYHSRAQSRGPGSQAGSTHSSHPKQPFHPGFRQPERFDNSQRPDRSDQPGRSQTPGYQPNNHLQDGRPDSAQSEPHASNNLETVPQPVMYPKKSSWEQLKQLTDSEYKLTYGASTYEHSESNV